MATSNLIESKNTEIISLVRSESQKTNKSKYELSKHESKELILEIPSPITIHDDINEINKKCCTLLQWRKKFENLSYQQVKTIVASLILMTVHHILLVRIIIFFSEPLIMKNPNYEYSETIQTNSNLNSNYYATDDEDQNFFLYLNPDNDNKPICNIAFGRPRHKNYYFCFNDLMEPSIIALILLVSSILSVIIYYFAKWQEISNLILNGYLVSTNFLLLVGVGYAVVYSYFYNVEGDRELGTFGDSLLEVSS